MGEDDSSFAQEMAKSFMETIAETNEQLMRTNADAQDNSAVVGFVEALGRAGAAVDGDVVSPILQCQLPPLLGAL